MKNTAAAPPCAVITLAPSTSTIPTLSQAFDDYCRIRSLRPATVKSYRTNMRALGDWQELKLTQITGRMCLERFNEMKDHSGFYFARQTFKVLHAIYEVARAYYEDADEQSLIKSNPVQKLTALKLWGKPKRRSDCLFPPEISAWFRSVQRLRNKEERDYLTWLLFTGWRASESACARFDWVNSGRGYIALPAQFTKTASELNYPLTDITTSFIKHLQNADEDTGYLFPTPGRYSNNGHLSPDNKAFLRVKKDSGCEVTRHGLRRTFASIGDSLNISGYALRRLLNHSDGGSVTAGYIIADLDRMRTAAQAITDKILDCIGVEPLIEKATGKTGADALKAVASLTDFGLFDCLLACYPGSYSDATKNGRPVNNHLAIFSKLGLTLTDLPNLTQ